MSQPLPSLLMDPSFVILECNLLFLLFVNQQREAILGKTLPDVLYADPEAKKKDWEK